MINYKKITVSYVYNPTVDEIFNALANKKVSHSTRHKKTFTNIKEAEIYEKNINKKGMFNFVDNDLSALFVFNYFKLKKFNPVLLWDTSQSNWCIFSNQNWQQYMKGK